MPLPTTTSLSVTPTSPVAKGAVMTLTASVTTNGAGVTAGTVIALTATVTTSGNPVTAGTVDFFDGKRLIGTATVNTGGSGVASLKSGFVTGQHFVTAVYSGAPYSSTPTAASVSQPTSVNVEGIAPSATVVSEAVDHINRPHFDFSALIAGFGSAPPTGSVTFFDTANGTPGETIGEVSLPGSASGFFLPAAQVAYPDSNSTGAVAVADVNADGIPDLIIGNGFLATTSVFLGVPGMPGQYQAPTVYKSSNPQQQFPITITVADLNGDGLPDLIVGNISNSPAVNGSIDIFLSDSQHPGQFLAPKNLKLLIQDFGTAYYPVSILVADINRDGVPDLAVGTTSNEGSGIGQVYVYLSDSASSTGYRPTFVRDGEGPQLSGVADFNNDGAMDLLSNGTEIIYGDPANPGTFLTRGSLPWPQLAILGEVAGDFNHDGLPDIAISASDSTIKVFLNNPASPGAFLPAVSYAVTQGQFSSTDLVTGDFNADGAPDLAEIDPTYRAVNVLLGDPNNPGAFEPQMTYRLDSRPIQLAVAPPGTNGLSDLFVTTAPAGLSVLKAASTGTVLLPNIGFSTAGNHPIVAQYSGDANYGASSSSVTVKVR